MRWSSLWLWVGLTSTALAQAPAGTPVKLMLLRDLGSGSSYPGDVVPFVVTEDVCVNGSISIPEGTMAFARVTKSRREGALSATLFDKPARLCLVFEHMRDLEGREVKLRPRLKQDGPLEITREMTVSPAASEAKDIRVAWENTTTRPVMDKVRKLFSDQAMTVSQREAEVLIAHNVRMPLVQEAIKQGLFGEVVSMIRDLRKGRVLEAMLRVSPVTRPALVAFRAVRELGRLSGNISNYVGGRFKGRNIQCPAGVELTVFTG